MKRLLFGTLARDGWLVGLRQSAWAACILAVALPIVLAQLGFFWLRKALFGVPINGYWGELGQCEAHHIGPNGVKRNACEHHRFAPLAGHKDLKRCTRCGLTEAIA